MKGPAERSPVEAAPGLEEQLLRAERRFRAAFDNPAVGVAIVGLDGRFLRVNGYLCRLTGYAEEELRRSTFSDVTHPDDIEIGVSHLNRLLRREILSCAFEKRYVRKDGQHVYLLISPTVLLDGDDRPLHFITQFQDLTESRRAEAARQDAEARFRIYVDHSPDGLFVIDEHARYVDANPAACELVGYSRRELLGLSIEDVVEPSRRALALTATRALIAGADLRRETILQHKNGDLVPVDLHAVKLSAGRFMALCRDMRPRLAAERERAILDAKLQQAQKLESLGLLAGGVAHDFNNLLVGILGNAELAQQDLAPQDPRRAAMQLVGVAAARAAELCNQLLAYAGGGQRKVTLVDLSQVAREALEVVPGSMLARASVVCGLLEALPPMAGDETQLRQIVMNLLTNACEALPSGQGTIRVSTGRTELGAGAPREGFLPADPPSGHYVHLEVSDDGGGMDEPTRSAMFDPFFTTKLTGQGLGLAALLGIVRAHSGFVRVVSAPGQGTAIRALFPVAAGSEPRSKPAPTPAQERTGSGLVLVIDDDSMVRRATAKMLELVGYDVTAAATGADAVAALRERQEQIRCVVMDLTMPDTTADDLLDRLRRVRPAVPILAVSGYADPTQASKVMNSPGVMFLQKPYSIQQLSWAVASMLDQPG
jgi:two-component system, cell cycle sensor histidine kinase and response regulator CckA